MTEWQPIETAPKDGTRILIWSKIETLGPYRMQFGAWQERHGRWSFCEIAGRNVDPTHWMPLPKPPKETGDE